MPKEIERKWILRDGVGSSWTYNADISSTRIVQGYLSGVATCSLRVANTVDGRHYAMVTISGPLEPQYWHYFFEVDSHEEIAKQNPEELNFRVRLAQTSAFITVKGKSTDDGLSRDEWELQIPFADAKEMISTFCLKTIHKTRHRMPWGDYVLEIDAFTGDNIGLVVVEIEFAEDDPRAHLDFDLPQWVGKEVTGDPKYYNYSLMKHPYTEWTDE